MDEPVTLTGTVGIANLPDLAPETWPEYFKQVPTRAVRVAGIAVAHSFGILGKDEASRAARKLLVLYGLLDAETSAAVQA